MGLFRGILSRSEHYLFREFPSRGILYIYFSLFITQMNHLNPHVGFHTNLHKAVRATLFICIVIKFQQQLS